MTFRAPNRRFLGQLLYVLLATAIALPLLGCGGGSGPAGLGGGSTPSARTVSVSPNPATVQAIARAPGSVEVVIRFPDSTPSGTIFYLGVVDPAGILQGGQFLSSIPGGFPLSLTTKPIATTGRTAAEVTLLVCRDEACKEHFPGSPIALRLNIDVSPNIEVQSLVNLSRTGAGPLPSATVPVSVPAAAGNIFLSFDPPSDYPVRARFENGQLVVTTLPARSGTYEQRVRFFQSGTAYSAETLIRYQVLPPPGGEQGWRVSGTTSFALRQGESSSGIATISAPTWIADPVTLLTPSSDIASWLGVRSLGDNRFEFSVRTAGLAPNWISRQSLTFAAGPYAEQYSVNVSLQVDPVFSVTAAAPVSDYSQTLQVTRASTAADLSIRYDVRMLDGTTTPVRWSIDAPSAWFKPRQRSGVVGVDPIFLDLDPKALQLGLFGSRDAMPPRDQAFQVSIDRAGVVATEIRPRFESGLDVLEFAQLVRPNSGPARLYVIGRFQFDGATAQRLRLTGARELSRTLVTDYYFVGDYRFLVVFDIDQLVDGQPLQLTLDSGLNSRTLTIPVDTLPAATEATLPLPAAVRRAPVASDDGQTLYWAEPGQIRVARRAGGSWTQQTLAVADLLDLDLSADGQRLQAVTTARLLELDPTTLQALRDVPVLGSNWPQAPRMVSAPPGTHAVVAGLENLPWVSVFASLIATNPNSNLVVRSRPDGSGQQWIEQRLQDRGVDPSNAAGILRAADRSAVLTFVPTSLGSTTGFDYLTARRFDMAAVRAPVALSRGAARVIEADGAVWDRTTNARISLGGLVPAGLVVRGWGIASSGQRAYAYASRPTVVGTQTLEADPAVLVFDLGSSPSPLVGRLVHSLPLTAAVNCPTPSTAAGDCENPVHVLAAADERQIVVSGRIAASIVPIEPSTVRAISGVRRVAVTPR